MAYRRGVKHLGILAHSVEGAALCFRTFCQLGFRELGPDQHPEVTLDCIPLARSMPGWHAGDHDAVRDILATSVDRLAAAGADFFISADNTAYLALGRPGEDLALPGLHLPEVVAEQARRDGRTKVGVLGTRFTMDGPLYPDALGARGIEAELPDEADRELVDKVIFDELLNGVITDGSRREYVRIIEQFAARGCDAVALVCTEIPLLVTPDVSPLPALDSTYLAARASFDVAVGREPLPTWRGGPLPA
jgi:aspartate racemase